MPKGRTIMFTSSLMEVFENQNMGLSIVAV